MSESLSALLYLVAAVCFIMALRGLSSPDTARAGNLYGIIGMAIAILTTLASPYVVSYWLIAVGLVIGGAVGPYSPPQIQMTGPPPPRRRPRRGGRRAGGLCRARGLRQRDPGREPSEQPDRDADRADDRRDHL